MPGKGKIVRVGLFLVLLLGLCATRLQSFLLFHSLAELFSIVVTFAIFVVAWNSRRFIGNAYLLVLGMAYLPTGAIDLLHTLAYKGMGVFPESGSNLATQLWIAARSIESFSLLAAGLMIGKKVRAEALLAVYAIVTAIFLASIFGGFFPTCHIAGSGLTRFKTTSEFAILLVLLAACALLLRQRQYFDRAILQMIIASIILTMAAEVAFISYVTVDDTMNLAGHCLKLTSFYLLYKAIVEAGFGRPFATLFRDLQRTQDELVNARDMLEQRVEERTAEMSALSARLLSAQEEERRLLARELHDDLTQRLAALSIETAKLQADCDPLPSFLQDGLTNLQGHLAKLSEDIHAISRQLHPSILDDLGLSDAIRSECDGFCRREGIPVEFEEQSVPESLPRDLALCVYRVAQHALKNIAKHADASRVCVALTGASNEVSLEIRDNGVGFDVERSSHKPGMGLVSMEERVRLEGGRFAIHSKPYDGTRVTVGVPIREDGG
jgi:signal transduction histidine kinase